MMGERQSTPERRPARQALTLLAVFALSACGNPRPAVELPPPPTRGGNFDLHYKGYEDPLVLNCLTGPREQSARFVGKRPRAYVFEMQDGAGETAQAMRLKVFGERSDVHATYWEGDPTERTYAGPSAANSTFIPLEPGATVQLRQTGTDPFEVEIKATCH